MIEMIAEGRNRTAPSRRDHGPEAIELCQLRGIGLMIASVLTK